MAVPFQIPNIEQFLPAGANVGAASLPQAPGPVASAPLSYFDPAQTEEFLKTIELAKPPEPQKLKTWQKVVGALGDAIQAMAAVRAGGQAAPLGPFAATQLQRSQQQREAEMSAEQANRETRNRIRIGRFEEGLRREREESVAKTRSTRAQRLIKSEFTREVGGVVHRFRQFSDPMSGEVVPVPHPETGDLVNELDLGVAGFAPIITPGVVGGEEGIFRVPRTRGGAGQIGAGDLPLGPKTTSEERDAVDSAFVLLDKIGRVVESAPKTRGGALEFGKNLLKQGVRAVPGGPQIIGRLDPNTENMASALKSIESIEQLLLTGKVANQTELIRLRGIAPQLADTTQPEVFFEKLNNFKREAAIKLQAKAARNPSAFTSQQLDFIDSLLSGAAPKKPIEDRLNELLSRPR